MHFIASSDKRYADERELKNMVSELLGIQYNIAKANRTDRKVQNLASYIKAVCVNSARTVLCRDMGSNPHIY